MENHDEIRQKTAGAGLGWQLRLELRWLGDEGGSNAGENQSLLRTE